MPYIESVIPLKRAGNYGRNEKIVIMVRFNKPVTVTGSPLLELKVRDKVLTNEDTLNGMSSSIDYQNATYLSTFSSHDIAIPIQDTDVLFEYTVKKLDWVKSLQHSKVHSITLNSGAAKILHKTMNPITIANTLMQNPDLPSLTNGKMVKQWKFRFPTRVDVLIRDFFHR